MYLFSSIRNLSWPIILSFTFLFFGCSSRDQKEELPDPSDLPAFSSRSAFKVGAYNVENFFDTLNTKGHDDEAFTPEGRMNWDSERYKRKIDHIAAVIHEIGEPAIMGLAEIENDRVLQDLTHSDRFKAEYRFIISNGQDPRGIEVAFIYQPEFFHPFAREQYPVIIKHGNRSRPILRIDGTLRNQDTLHLFMCHWPSRAGGRKRSEPSRVHAAKILRKKVSSIMEEKRSPNILIMGDLNDHPGDKSVEEVLKAKRTIKREGELKDLFFEEQMEGLGSYFYQGDPGFLDHLIVSRSLVDQGSSTHYEQGSEKVSAPPMILFETEDGGHLPDRTYGGEHYFGGYSDHLPVTLRIRVQER